MTLTHARTRAHARTHAHARRAEATVTYGGFFSHAPGVFAGQIGTRARAHARAQGVSAASSAGSNCSWYEQRRSNKKVRLVPLQAFPPPSCDENVMWESPPPPPPPSCPHPLRGLNPLSLTMGKGDSPEGECIYLGSETLLFVTPKKGGGVTFFSIPICVCVLYLCACNFSIKGGPTARVIFVSHKTVTIVRKIRYCAIVSYIRVHVWISSPIEHFKLAG